MASASVIDSRIKSSCFRATNVAKQRVQVKECMSDSLNMARNDDIRRIADALKIDMKQLIFRGCRTSIFSAKQDDDSGKYLVTYSTDATPSEMLAVMAHELAHVRQMMSPETLVPSTSKQMELGADFVAGLLYGRLFPDRSLMEFQNNLQLLARYNEVDEEAHGTPSQRTSAFRMGVFRNMDEHDSDYGQALAFFYHDLYAPLVRI